MFINEIFSKIPCKNGLFFVLKNFLTKPVEKRVLYSIITARWEILKTK